VGLDFDMFGVKGGITYYNEKMRNGYTLRMVPQVLSFREYETYKGTEVPVYMDDPNNPGQPVLGRGRRAARTIGMRNIPYGIRQETGQ